MATPSTPPSAAASPVGSTLAITSLPFHGGEVGIQYVPISLGASGGKPPYQWSITDGTFPPGLTLSTSGSVSGTNSAGGRFDFTVHVVDSAGAVANLGSSVQIYSPLVTAAYCAGQCAVEDGCTNACGVFGGASGGLGPYGYTITAGGVPPGMGLSGLTLTGTFQAGGVGAYNLTVVVSDQYGAHGTVGANWYVFPHIAFSQTTATCGNSPSSCSIQIPYTGGKPGGTPSAQVTGVTNGTISVPSGTGGCQTPVSQVTSNPPPGMRTSAGGGVMALAAGPPDGKTWCFYSATITFVLVDQSPCAPGANCVTNNVLTVRFGL